MAKLLKYNEEGRSAILRGIVLAGLDVAEKATRRRAAA